MTDSVRAFRSRAARILRPRMLPDIVDWLPANVNIRDNESDYQGPFSFDNCPDLKEIARSCVSPDIETTVIVGPTQSFKSTLLIGVAAYTIGVDPGPIGWVLGNEHVALAFSTKRIQPVIEGSPVLAALKPDDDDQYKNLELGFKTCTVRLAGSNSPSNAATFSYKRVLGDEVDKYPAQLGTESGTLDLLLLRTDQYTHHNHIFASSPTVPEGTIWRAALRGDCRRYHVICRHCGKLFVQEFAQLRWDQKAKSRRGTWDFARVAKTAHMECPHCQGEIWENDRRDMLHAGQWIPDPVEAADLRRLEKDLIADPRRRSYFRSCFNVLHPNRTFAAIAQKHLTAGVDPSARQNFTNGQLGEVHEEKIERMEWETLYERREAYLDGDNPDAPAISPMLLPEGVLLLAVAIDAQENPARLELEIVGFGEGDESWGIQYKVIDGDPLELSTWLRAEPFLQYAWHHPAGHWLRPAIVCIDTGYATKTAYAFVARCQPRRVLAVKGSSGGYGEPLVFRPKKSGVQQVPLWMVGTVTAKQVVYSRLRIADHGPGHCHFPRNPRRGYDQVYFRGLVAERPVWKYETGRKVLTFKPGDFKRNEPLDIRCYILAGLDILRPDYAAIARRFTHEKQTGVSEEIEKEIHDSLGRSGSDQDGSREHGGKAIGDSAIHSEEKEEAAGQPAAPPAENKISDGGVSQTDGRHAVDEGSEPVAAPDSAQAGSGVAQNAAPACTAEEFGAALGKALANTEGGIDALEAALPEAPPPTQATRPAPNLVIPRKFRQHLRRQAQPRRGGFVQGWR